MGRQARAKRARREKPFRLSKRTGMAMWCQHCGKEIARATKGTSLPMAEQLLAVGLHRQTCSKSNPARTG